MDCPAGWLQKQLKLTTKLLYISGKIHTNTLKITVLKRPQIRLPPPPPQKKMAIFGGVNFFSERGLILS